MPRLAKMSVSCWDCKETLLSDIERRIYGYPIPYIRLFFCLRQLPDLSRIYFTTSSYFLAHRQTVALCIEIIQCITLNNYSNEKSDSYLSAFFSHYRERQGTGLTEIEHIISKSHGMWDVVQKIKAPGVCPQRQFQELPPEGGNGITVNQGLGRFAFYVLGVTYNLNPYNLKPHPRHSYIFGLIIDFDLF